MAVKHYIFLGLYLVTQFSYASSEDNWDELTPQQQKVVLQHYQTLKDVPENQNQLQQRMDWFTQLPENEKQKIRDVWQNMSVKARKEMRLKMQKAKNKTERNKIRNEYMQKFNDTHQ